jgi:hypothetical protein
MACLSYLIVESTLSCHAGKRLNPIAGNRLWFDRDAALQHRTGIALAKKSLFVA